MKFKASLLAFLIAFNSISYANTNQIFINTINTSIVERNIKEESSELIKSKEYIDHIRELHDEMDFLEYRIENSRKKFYAVQYNKISSRSYSHNVRSFIDFDLTIKSNLTENEIQHIIKGTRFEGYERTLFFIQESIEMNILGLLAIAKQESGLGNSYMAKKKNNYFGYGAFDSNPGLAIKYKTPEEGLIKVAQNIKNDYLTENGPYNRGTHFKGMNVMYASDTKWAQGCASHLAGFYETLYEYRLTHTVNDNF